MPLRKPSRANFAHLGKVKRLATNLDPTMLENAAKVAFYSYSPYHCTGPNGEPPVSRVRPASVCPRRWGDGEATQAIRTAILRGLVSEKMDGDLPRYAWNEAEGTLYEARHSSSPTGNYHAYPISLERAPIGWQP
jgi:hypothetical protein